jgi:L-ascorbate metabolism protein UlaG (beta-lactamase superfamily)
MMARRTFLQKTIQGLKAMALFNFMPGPVAHAAVEPVSDDDLHYKLLDGVSLKELVARKAHHGVDGRFHNPLGDARRRRRFGELLRWKLFAENGYQRYLDEQPITPVRVDWQGLEKTDGVSVTFIKHASVLIKDQDKHLIIDPVFRDMFWFIQDFSPLAFDLQAMPRIDHILITHGHYDHLNTPTLAAFDTKTHVIAPLGYDDLFDDLGMTRRTHLDWYEAYSDGRRKITLLPCNHWTMRNPLVGPNRALWGSYMIETAGGRTIYVSGDTAFFDGFREIGRQYDIDLAIINLGAYEPRWFMAPSHMNPRETVAAFQQLGAKRLMVVHWGTFRLGDEPVHFPPMELRAVMEKEGLLDRWVDIRHGETHVLA